MIPVLQEIMIMQFHRSLFLSLFILALGVGTNIVLYPRVREICEQDKFPDWGVIAAFESDSAKDDLEKSRTEELEPEISNRKDVFITSKQNATKSTAHSEPIHSEPTRSKSELNMKPESTLSREKDGIHSPKNSQKTETDDSFGLPTVFPLDLTQNSKMPHPSGTSLPKTEFLPLLAEPLPAYAAELLPVYGAEYQPSSLP
ncbi:MAG: hypothetical protein ACRCUY_12760 [Thermoguttaceae bacterium]